MLHADHEKPYSLELGHFIDTVIATNFDPVAAQLYDDYMEEDGSGAHVEASAMDLAANVVDSRVWRLCTRPGYRALWQAVRIFQEAKRAGDLPLPALHMPPCLHDFLSTSTPGKFFDLSEGLQVEGQTLCTREAVPVDLRCRWGAACARIGRGCAGMHAAAEIRLAADLGITAALDELAGTGAWTANSRWVQ